MKPEELQKFDELVTQRMKEILRRRFNVEVSSNRKEILEVASRFDSSEINELVFALRRIEKGIYGQCVICRHDILPDILKVNPTARFCSSCEMAMQDKTAP